MSCDPHIIHHADVLEECASFLAFLASWAAAIAAAGEEVTVNNAIQAPEAFEWLCQSALTQETTLRKASKHIMGQCECYTVEPEGEP